jgi:hypothetical protein
VLRQPLLQQPLAHLWQKNYVSIFILVIIKKRKLMKEPTSHVLQFY